jgi:hypothetical protein
MSDFKTKFNNAKTIVTADFANSIYGGLKGTSEAEFLPDDDPRVSGHIHDGQNKDGHASKIDLVDNVKGQIRNSNIADFAITKRNINAVIDSQFAIPEFEIIDGQTRYYLDLSDLRSESVSLSNDNPLSLGSVSPGISNDASRSDHVHEVPNLDDIGDVSLGAVSDRDVLTYSSITGEWSAMASGGWPTNTDTDINGRAYEQALVATANTSLAITPTGTGGLQAHIADNTSTGGNARGTRAVDWQMERDSAAQVASGLASVINGGRRNTASGDYSIVSGGNFNIASQLGTIVAGGNANESSGTYASITGGQSNIASGDYASVGGSINVASGIYSTIPGGEGNTASGFYSIVIGGLRGLSDKYGMLSHASGEFSAQGDAQYSRMILRRETVNDTPVLLTANGGVGSSTTVPVLAANSAYMFEIYIIARHISGGIGVGSVAWWKISGGIKRDGLDETVLVGTNSVVTQSDAPASGWVAQVLADNITESISVTVTGESNKVIRWVATVNLTKVSAS